MHARIWLFVVLSILSSAALAGEAAASRQNPGSCVLFPYFDTSGATMSIHTLTNVGEEKVAVRLVFIPKADCLPIDYFIVLEGGDTLTFGAHGFLAQKQTGFLYAYVVESLDAPFEEDADVLIGHEMVLGVWDSHLVNISLNPVHFQALDVIKDEKLRLDGKEYTAAPKDLYFPRFFGQDEVLYSKMILINLTGGKYFTVSADCYIYNDNGVYFSDQVKFGCFEIMKLQDISPATLKSFLLSTSHDPSEPWPFYSLAETGWLSITGQYAVNTPGTVQIDHASIYGVLVEGVGSLGFSWADLPSQVEDPSLFNHAMLWSTSLNGN